MKAKNKIIIGFIIFFSLFLVWYLAIKESDYCIRFTVNTASGTIFQGVQEWSALQLDSKKEKYSTLEKSNYSFIKQDLKKGGIHMEYSWDIKSINDSVSSVSVGVKDLNHSIYNRLTAPFYKTAFRIEQVKKITEFKKGLENHLKNFKIKIIGEGRSEATYVAYITLKSVMQEKAQQMIRNDDIITGFLHSNAIKITGSPYVEIVNWDQDKEILDFNYCFPIDKNVKVIEDANVKFKTIAAVKGLRASYFGNFRTSDRAWFALLDYANRKGIELENKPLEHFLANPFNGGDELSWETEIIIPFAKK